MSVVGEQQDGGSYVNVIRRARVTEKTTHQGQKYNCYSFVVASDATKADVKRAVEDAFGVRVLSVRTSMHVGKRRRFKGLVGMSAPEKRAIVCLHPDDRISII